MSSRRIKPAKQGQLDGACGFYAILNAMTALEHSLQRKEVFTQVIAAFMQDGNFSKYFDGTKRGTIKNTLSRVIDYFNTEFEFFDDKTQECFQFEFSIPYWLKGTSPSRKEVLEYLDLADNGKEYICIVGYDFYTGDPNEPLGGHWSVVRKTSEKGLHMLDSSEEKSIIPLGELTVDSSRNPGPSKPYNLTSADIFIIRKKWLGELVAL